MVPALFSAPMPLPWKSVPAAGHLRSMRVSRSKSVAFQTRAWTPRCIALQRGFPVKRASPLRGGKTAFIVRAAAQPAVGDDESYQLDISPEKAVLAASTAEGALHGLETFAQLIRTGPRRI